MVYIAGVGYVHPRPKFSHYSPNVGPVFNSLRVAPLVYSADGEGEVKKAPGIIGGLTDAKCKSGELVTLRCEIHGMPKPTIEWRRGLDNITADCKFWTHYDGRRATLTIQSAMCEDAGWYTCKASNELGSCTTSGLLHVLDNDNIYSISQQPSLRGEYNAAQHKEQMYMDTYFLPLNSRTFGANKGKFDQRRKDNKQKYYFYKYGHNW